MYGTRPEGLPTIRSAESPSLKTCGEKAISAFARGPERENKNRGTAAKSSAERLRGALCFVHTGATFRSGTVAKRLFIKLLNA